MIPIPHTPEELAYSCTLLTLKLKTELLKGAFLNGKHFELSKKKKKLYGICLRQTC